MSRAKKLHLTNVHVPVLGHHIIEQYGSARAFRVAKRRQIRNALRAIDQLVQGCAFIPRGQVLARDAENAIRELQVACSVKEWQR